VELLIMVTAAQYSVIIRNVL